MKHEKQLMLGDEAIAQGALDAGISGVYAYPGTPSTEIMEYVQHSAEAAALGVHREWSSNEKTAMEEALGMSYAGRRVIVCMKHVGLNVAADPFVNAAVTGTQGGLVVVVADDPSMYSSQNEQDSRYYADFAGIPFFEPRNQQEAYDLMGYMLDLSEQHRLPVLMRVTTRLAHSRADVVRGSVRKGNPLNPPKDHRQFTLLPANARRNFEALTKKQPVLLAQSESSMFNTLDRRGDASVGIVATGLAGNYLDEAFAGRHPAVYIRHYPAPVALLKSLYDSCESLLILEEGAPYLERQLMGLLGTGKPIHGRCDGTLPRTGELTPDLVTAALRNEKPAVPVLSPHVQPRPPQLCKGCPHIDTYLFLNDALVSYEGARVFADIGCYTLGALPPFESIHTCVDMGASITMAKGAEDAGLRPALAVIGDSTFTHSGMTGLLDAVYENTPITVLILDNDTTAMTGQQSSMATGRLEQICRGLGVAEEHVRVVIPLKKNHEENAAVLKAEIDYPGVSVIISRRPCIQLKRRM